MTVVARCVELGIAHGDIHDRGEFGISMDVADPAGTLLRFRSSLDLASSAWIREASPSAVAEPDATRATAD